MRKDIDMDIDNGDIASRRRPPAYSSKLKWVDEDYFYVYGECILDNSIPIEKLVGGVGVHIPQLDNIKPIKIMFSVISIHGEKLSTEYMIVKTLGGDGVTGVKLPTVSDDMYFRIYLPAGGENFIIAAGYQLDLSVGPSIDQNEYFLLISGKSSLYEYPSIGVGLKSYLNGDIVSSDLPMKIQSEFKSDGMIVSNIKYDEATGEIVIESNEI